MGTLYLDGVPVGDPPYRHLTWDDGIAGPSILDLEAGQRSMTTEQCDAALAYAERRRRITLAKSAAEIYRKRPQVLNPLGWATQFKSAEDLLRAVPPKRDSKAPAGINPRGVRIYARWKRRFDESPARIVAREMANEMQAAE